MASFNTWNFREKHVQSGLTEGQNLAAQSVLLAFGPPYLSAGDEDVSLEGSISGEVSTTGIEGAGDVIFPAGLIGSFGLGMQRPLIPVGEIGSTQMYTVVGPMTGSVQFGRTLVHGPSLLRAYMAYFKATSDEGELIEGLIGNDGLNRRRNPLSVIDEAPGYENFWVNLNSEIFEQPAGMLMYIKDSNDEAYGAVYLENMNVASLSMGLDPGRVTITESSQATFTRARPVRLARVVPIMSRLEARYVGTTAIAGSRKTVPGVTGDNRYQRTNTAKNQ